MSELIEMRTLRAFGVYEAGQIILVDAQRAEQWQVDKLASPVDKASNRRGGIKAERPQQEK